MLLYNHKYFPCIRSKITHLTKHLRIYSPWGCGRIQTRQIRNNDDNDALKFIYIFLEGSEIKSILWKVSEAIKFHRFPLDWRKTHVIMFFVPIVSTCHSRTSEVTEMVIENWVPSNLLATFYYVDYYKISHMKPIKDDAYNNAIRISRATTLWLYKYVHLFYRINRGSLFVLIRVYNNWI